MNSKQYRQMDMEVSYDLNYCASVWEVMHG